MKRIFAWYEPVVLAAALAGAFTASANALESRPVSGTNSLTLEAAIRLALENKPDLRASGARVEAAAGQAQQAGKWSNPELEVSAEDWPVNQDNGFSDAKQLIGISQALPYPGKKSLARRVGVAGVKLSGAELAGRRAGIVRDVKANFYRVLAAERMAEVSDRLVSVAESAARTARKRVDAGAATLQEQLRAEVQLEQARTEQADKQRDLAAVRQEFATLLGRPEIRTVRLEGELRETPDTALLQAPVEAGWSNHPSLMAAQWQVEHARLEARRTRLDKYPDVKLGVAGGRVGATDESILQIGVSIPLPVLDRGRGREHEANANVDVAQAELEAVGQHLRREWANAQLRYQTATKQVARFREQILPKAEQALRLVQTGFEEGKFSFMDLVDTQRTDAGVHLAFQEKLLELNLAHVELEALLQPQTISTPDSRN